MEHERCNTTALNPVTWELSLRTSRVFARRNFWREAGRVHLQSWVGNMIVALHVSARLVKQGTDDCQLRSVSLSVSCARDRRFPFVHPTTLSTEASLCTRCMSVRVGLLHDRRLCLLLVFEESQLCPETKIKGTAHSGKSALTQDFASRCCCRNTALCTFPEPSNTKIKNVQQDGPNRIAALEPASPGMDGCTDWLGGLIGDEQGTGMVGVPSNAIFRCQISRVTQVTASS